ncbi:toxin-antitoxin system YwqK family antitoxin [Hymenobacter arizonensis]|uniref:toxin-antitoxin system YwqK family antitoxin n=1 Tax=Hymenobacter arizonensis TaxID=1227077 RepID=UPI0015A5A82E|nr:hypothetical protein [Hymenobacter arizonensis]
MRRTLSILGRLFALLLPACGPREEVGYYPGGEVRYRAPLDAQGLYDGEVKTFHSNGAVKGVTPYRKSHVTGVAQRYYPSGQLESEEHFRNDKTFGLLRHYYPTGQLKYEAKLYGSVYADTAFLYHPNGELRQMIVYDGQGRKIDYGVWSPSGLRDRGYTRPLVLSDRDTIPEGQDYAFEVVLGNRRSDVVSVKILRPVAGIDSTKGMYARTRFLLRRPAPGPHVVTGVVRNKWARKGSDTVWTDRYDFRQTFWVHPASDAE